MYHIFEPVTRNLATGRVMLGCHFETAAADENGGALMQITLQSAGGRAILKSLLLALMLGAAPAQGMIYMWRDSAGIAHYSNKEYDVPARYKAKVKVLYPDASDSRGAPPGNAAVQAPPVAPPPAAVGGQGAKPEVQPDVRPAVTAPQVKSAPPKPPERRGRKQRERSGDDE